MCTRAHTYTHLLLLPRAHLSGFTLDEVDDLLGDHLAGGAANAAGDARLLLKGLEGALGVGETRSVGTETNAATHLFRRLHGKEVSPHETKPS